MPEVTQITDKIAVGSQPTPDDIGQLKAQGYRTVINLRVDNEDEDMVTPEDEGELVRGEGMTYMHLPVTMLQLRQEQVDEFRNAVEVLDAPIYVHCKKGKRAGIFSLLHKAVEQDWSPDKTMAEAAKAGFACDEPSLAAFVTCYVKDRSPA